MPQSLCFAAHGYSDIRISVNEIIRIRPIADRNLRTPRTPAAAAEVSDVTEAIILTTHYLVGLVLALMSPCNQQVY